MYLFLGGSTVVPHEDVVAVCDLDNSSSSRVTRDYLARAEREGRVLSASEDIPKSFVVCESGGAQTVYLSQLSSATLLKRAESNSME